MTSDLDDHTKEELQEMARERDVAVSGTKDELVDRLREADGAQQQGRSANDSSASPFRRALDQLRDEFQSTTGLSIEVVTALSRADDGGWSAKVQVVEQRRVPPTSDMLGIYDVAMDSNGEMTSLERIERIVRGRSSS